MSYIRVHKRTFSRVAAIFCLLFLLVAIPFNTLLAESESQKETETEKSYSSWQELGHDMYLVFEEARSLIDEGDFRGAYDKMNEAYFGYYEVLGFEKNVMTYVSAKRVNHIEASFRDIKHGLIGNYDHNEDELKTKILVLAGKVYRDSLVLDGIEDKDSSDEAGVVVFSNEEDKAAYLTALGVDVEVAEEQAKAEPTIQEVDPAVRNRRSFFTSFILMLREGMEAILVCVAIITYLVKTGHHKYKKAVYMGMLAGLIGSVFLAILVNYALGGVGQELIEGWTMFLAVIVLFWVSNWMLSKSSEQAWEHYIQDQVSKSLDKRSVWGLVGAAFLAVIREGAELILFYRASFGSNMTDSKSALYGLLAAVGVLVLVWVVMRYTTVRLPLKSFFLFTSILLFVLCISFMGKGVKELSEAGVISGVTSIPAMNGFQIDALGIYDRAETLIPQIILLIASLWILLSHTFGKKREKKLNTKLSEPVTTDSTETTI